MEEGIPPPPPPGAESSLRRKLHSALRWRFQERRAKSKLSHDAGENDGNSSSFLGASFSSISSSTDTEEGDDGAPGPLIVAHGSVSLIGRRREMEDALTEAPGFLASHDFFAVFDGHGGATVAETCRVRMHVVLAEEAAAADGDDERWRAAMAACFAKVDREVAEAAETKTVAGGIVGSTAVVVVVGERRIVVANCGVSRAVLCRGGAAVPLSNDHKPNRPDELERVVAAGGRVINWNGHRIMGVLATSRSIGDLYLKPFVTAEPEVTMIYRTEKDEFLILASDGLWDVVSNDMACQVARQCFTGPTSKRFPEEEGGCTAAAATLLARHALSGGSKDNISVVVVQLKRF